MGGESVGIKASKKRGGMEVGGSDMEEEEPFCERAHGVARVGCASRHATVDDVDARPFFLSPPPVFFYYFFPPVLNSRVSLFVRVRLLQGGEGGLFLACLSSQPG